MGKTPLENEAGNRERLTLAEEKRINETAVCRVVGLTIETRPDTINEEELRFLRRLGVTRVQLGVQHIDDQILDKVNRRCSTEKTVKAFELLKRNCFKIDAHWMPNLPGSSEKKDRHMFIDVLLGLSKTMMVPKRYTKQSHTNGAATVEQWEEYDLAAPELQTDQWKIYPTAITPWTEIEKWFKEGTYVQYPEQDVFNLIYDTMSMVWPWIRLNRIIRDIPHCYMYNEETGSDNTNMRQQLDVVLKQDGIHCMDIRNREVKDGQWDGSYGIVIRKYNASNGTEYFISAESADNKTLYGFVRLRLDDARDKAFPELNGCGLIRECHVYGDLSKVGTQGKHVQHRGVGRTVMLRAEELAKSNGYRKLAVISAEGTKRYYMDKLGYQSGVGSDSFLVKVLV
jgi:histone acetyltransferase (RNA polymerase elongator complex component)